MAISFVASSSWTTNSSGTGFTIQKPAGTVSGDLMVAIVAIQLFPSATTVTITNPSGWSTQDSVSSPPDLQIRVMHRVAGSSEPSSWNGSISASRIQRVTICGTYRGSTFITPKGTSSIGGATTLNTATINNPASDDWRMVFGAYVSSTANYTIGSNELTQRKIDQAVNGPDGYTSAIQAGLWDSGGTIASGNTSRNITRGAVWESAASWIAIMQPDDPAVDGTLSATLSKPTMTASGSIGYDGTLAATLPSMPAVSMSGISTPPEGPLDVLVLPVVSMSGATAASGSLVVLAGPTVTLNGETRFFGVRVVTPERELEKRITTPRLGAVD